MHPCHSSQHREGVRGNTFETLLVRKSKWTPPEGQFASLDFFTKKCRHDIHKLKFNRNTKFSNLSSEEWAALKNLSKRNDIVVKSADKGGAVVVWRSDLYQKEALRQLSDTSFYAKIPKDLTSKNQKLVKDTIQNLIVNQELPDTATNLIINTPRTSCIYFLFFEKRAYPVSVVKAGHHRAQQFDRQSSLQTSQKDKNDRIPFTLTFHPHNHAVKSIILSNFKLLQNDPETGRIFSQPPLISFKRDKNVGNFLVRSALKTHEQPGTFKCARSRCNTCRFIVNTSKISGPKRSVKITDRFTCTSANVIYCITCTLCNKLYIGETGRRLGDRFREHLRDVEKNDKDASKPVARHFNLPNHSKKHMAVCGLSLHLGTTESRKNLEQKFIFQIGTLNPHGINERFSFN